MTCTTFLWSSLFRLISSVSIGFSAFFLYLYCIDLNIVKKAKLGKQIRTFTLSEDNEVTKLVMEFYADLEKILGG